MTLDSKLYPERSRESSKHYDHYCRKFRAADDDSFTSLGGARGSWWHCLANDKTSDLAECWPWPSFMDDPGYMSDTKGIVSVNRNESEGLAELRVLAK